MRVCSFNLWSDAPRNARWPARRDAVADVLRRTAPDVAGLQEATLPMIHDLHQRLPKYGWVGVGRDDGIEAGEFTPIFYHTERVRVLEQASFWLAEDWEKPGRGWDAAHARVVSWARFEDFETGGQFVQFNTHLDHLGRHARTGGARLLRSKIEETAAGDPAVMTGDFNCRESSAPYRILTGHSPFAGPSAAPGALRDTFHDAAEPPSGRCQTYLGVLSLLGFARIDYVFVNEGFRTLRHSVISAPPGASDHRPVLAELAFTSPGNS